MVTEQLILKVPGGGGSEEPIQEKLWVYLKSSARPSSGSSLSLEEVTSTV